MYQDGIKLPDPENKIGAILHIGHYITQRSLYAQLWLARVNSGAYKLRKVDQGCERTPEHPDGWRPFSEEELLKDALKIAQGHIQAVSEASDNQLELIQALLPEEIKTLQALAN